MARLKITGGARFTGGLRARRSTLFVTLDSNQQDYDLGSALNLSLARDIEVTINSGVVVSASDTGTPAFTTGTLPAGSSVKITNNGRIQGTGGGGGDGGNAGSGDGSAVAFPGSVGQDGGAALNLTLDTTVDNTNGEIFGGAGGGGGGRGYRTASNPTPPTPGNPVPGDKNTPPSTNPPTSNPPNPSTNLGGGGGGGGAGTLAGSGASGGTGENGAGTPGDPGSAGNPNPGATGGGDGGAGGGAPASAGGPGGNPGASGTPGVGPDGGTGGSAGNAVALNGNAITWLGGNSSPNVEGSVA